MIRADASIRPVRETAARELTRRFLAALALVLAVHPLHLAGGGIERDDRASRAGGRVEPATDHQRRRLEVELGPRSEVVGLEPPRHLEVVEVVLVDLIERLVARARQIGAVGAPLAAAYRPARRGRRQAARATAATDTSRELRRQTLLHRGHTVPCSLRVTARSPL